MCASRTFAVDNSPHYLIAAKLWKSKSSSTLKDSSLTIHKEGEMADGFSSAVD